MKKKERKKRKKEVGGSNKLIKGLTQLEISAIRPKTIKNLG
jgi:hypothetical protein